MKNYQSNICISIKLLTAKINLLKSEPLINAINALGGWPLLQQQKKNEIKLTELMGKIISNYGDNYFVSFDVDSNWKDPNKTMLHVSE